MLPAPSPSLSSLSSCSSPGQAVRKCLTYNELPISIKVRLIRDYETQNCSQRSLARKYTVSRGTVNQIIKQKSRYVTEFAKMQSMAEGSAGGMRGNANCMTLKRIRKTSVTNVNHVLEQFVAESRINKWTLTGPKLKQKAREVAQGMGLSDFKASNGWLDSFKKRCSLEFNSEKLAAASGRRSNQENRSDLFDQNLQDMNNNNSCNNFMSEHLNSQTCDSRLDVSPFNLMDLNDDADKPHNQLTSSSNTSSSPHSSDLNFTAESTVPLELHFSDSISVPGSDGVAPSSGPLQVDDFSPNTGANENCPNQSEWIIGFDTNDASTATAPPPDSNQQHGLPDHSSLHQAHLRHHPHHHPPQQQLAVQLQAQHSHPEQTLADDQPANPHLDSLPHTLSLPSDQMIQLELAGHMDSALTGSRSSSSQVRKHSSTGHLMSQDVKHCRLLLTVNANSGSGNSSNCDKSSPSSKCHHSESGSQIEVPAIADVRSAIDTLERFALTKMPPLLSSILSIRQEVGNFVIQQQMLLQDQFNHHHQHQLQQQQQQHSQNHLLNQ